MSSSRKLSLRKQTIEILIYNQSFRGTGKAQATQSSQMASKVCGRGWDGGLSWGLNPQNCRFGHYLQVISELIELKGHPGGVY